MASHTYSPPYEYQVGDLIEYRLPNADWRRGCVIDHLGRQSSPPHGQSLNETYRVQDIEEGGLLTLKTVNLRTPVWAEAKIIAPRPEPMLPLLPTDSDARKALPITTGVLDYFPAVIRELARLSHLGNEKHNPGEPLHHARDKSNDHENCIARHTLERGGFETIVVNGVEHRVRHSVCRAWRALAAAQIELEEAAEAPVAITPRPR